MDNRFKFSKTFIDTAVDIFLAKGFASRGKNRDFFYIALYGPFKPTHHSKDDLTLNEVSQNRFGTRRSLLAGFDQFRRDVDYSGQLAGMDAFTQQALGVLTSSKMANAMDLEKEDPKVRERYGKGDSKNFGDGAPRNNTHFLLARRLVEAGARCVTLNFGRWDFHSKIYDEKSGDIWLNEINTLPGFTSQSMYPMLWEASGVALSDLVAQLVYTARE